MWLKLRYQVSGWGWDEATQLFVESDEQWERTLRFVFLFQI